MIILFREKVPKKRRGLQKTGDERWMKDGARRDEKSGREGGAVRASERAMRGKTDEQDQPWCLGPGDRSTPSVRLCAL